MGLVREKMKPDSCATAVGYRGGGSVAVLHAKYDEAGALAELKTYEGVSSSRVGIGQAAHRDICTVLLLLNGAHVFQTANHYDRVRSKTFERFDTLIKVRMQKDIPFRIVSKLFCCRVRWFCGFVTT